MALEYVLNIKDNGTAVLTKVSQKANVLQQNLTLVDQSLNVFNKGLTKAGAAVAGWAAAGMVKATSALKDFAKETIQSYDSAVKLSDNIGIAAESIIGLRYAADQSNVGSEAMDKNMAKLSKTISDAASGSKQAADTFAKMGISVKNSDGSVKNSEQVLYEMADAFEKLPAGAQRATLAMEVFGKSGAPMVSMLKDGSSALKEVSSEGISAAGNIDSISQSMVKFNTASTRSKAAIMGLMATLSDSSAFNLAINSLDLISKKMISIAAASKQAANQERDAMKETLKRNAIQKEQLQSQLDAGEITQVYYDKRMSNLIGENVELQMKNKLTADEVRLAEISGALNHYYSEQKIKGASTWNSMQIKNLKAERDEIKERQKAIDDEKAGAASALASFNENENKKNEAAKNSAKIFEEAMKKKEAAIKSLADFDEKARMASLDGEDLLLAKYEQQLEQLDELNNIAGGNEVDHINRRLNLHTQFENELKKLQKETADKQEENIKKLADFDEKMRIAGLEGEAQKIAQSEYNKQNQIEEADKLFEALIAENENDIALREEHNARVKAIESQHAAEVNKIKEDFSDAEKKRLQAEMNLRLDSAASTLNAMQQAFQGQREFAGLYKASAIGEAVINATQAVLKTMSSVPFPFNVPLAAAQSAAGAAQVGKIASTKMFSGGMIPGRNTLIMANEEGPEAILNTRAVRSIGGPAGVNELNRGHTNNNTYNNNRSDSILININTSIMTQQAYRSEIEPVFERAKRRR